MPRCPASSAGLRSTRACASGSTGALRARWHQQVYSHAQLCCARSADGASDGHCCALSLCSWVLTWSMTILASSMYLRAREEALLVPHAHSSFCTAWSGRRCMRSCARPSVLLCFIKPTLGNCYVWSRGFIVSEPRETHPQSEISNVPTLPCPPLDNPGLGCPDPHPPP